MTASHQKTQPCDYREFAILRSLCLSPEACRWFVDMGIGWEVFKDKRCQVIATWALAGCKGSPPKVEAAFNYADPGAWSISEWIDTQIEDFKPEWGLADIKRHCRELAPRWFPVYLREQAKYVENVGVVNGELIDAASHHRKTLDFLGGAD